jgi:hypothetical protein
VPLPVASKLPAIYDALSNIPAPSVPELPAIPLPAASGVSGMLNMIANSILEVFLELIFETLNGASVFPSSPQLSSDLIGQTPLAASSP